MNIKLALLAFVTLVSGQLCPAQTNPPADDWKSATTNQRGKEYPQVNSEGRVRGRIAASQALSVQLEVNGLR
jgi:enterochelin esterase family protein